MSAGAGPVDSIVAAPAADAAGRLLAEAMQHVAVSITSVQGENVLRELASFLCRSLDVDFALIGRRCEDHIETLAACDRGTVVDNIAYELAGTPCATVWGNKLQIIPDGLMNLFPGDNMITQAGFLSYAGLPLFDSAGEPIGIIAILGRRPFAEAGLVGALLRIYSVRAAAELERLRAESALREAESSYRAIFDAGEDPIFVHDWDTGAIIDVNAKACEVYGYSREQLINATVDEISSGVEPYTGVQAALWIERAKHEGTVQFEWHRKGPDGSLQWDEVRLKRAMIGGKPRILAFTRQITGRKLAEEALRASEEQYRAIFNATDDALILWDSQLRPVDVNTAYERNYGWSREDVLVRGYDNAYSAEYTRPRVEMVRRALAGEPCRAELEAIRKNGERFPTEVHTIPFVHRGAPHVLAIARDITERKRAEEALRASEEQYRSIFSASADGLLLVDRDARVIDVNPAFTQMFGYTREGLAGTPIEQLGAYANSARMREMMGAASRGESFEAEGVARRLDGTRFQVNARGTPVLYRGEAHLLVTIRDITRRIEEQQKLVRSEQRLRATIESSLDCIVAADVSGRIIEINPMAERTFRISAQEAIGRDMSDLTVPGRVRETYRGTVAAFLAGERPDLAGRRFEVVAQRADGEEFAAELAMALAESADGRVFIAFLRDLTEQKAATAQSEQLQAQLRQAQKMDAIGHLAGGIAHDFNNLLTSLTGYVSMAQERLEAAGEQRASRHLEKSLRSAERARNLVQQLLVFSRGQRGDRVAVDLVRHLAEFEELLRSTLPSSVQFSSEYEPGLPAVMVDPTQIDQVLMNLCINARDAMEAQGSLRVSVRGRHVRGAVCSACRKDVQGNFIELTVSDSGQGITPEVLERMFDPFFTTKQAGKGTGMGLSTTHGIVHDYGGHILVDTETGRGTSFRVLLPQLDAAVAAQPDKRIGAGSARPGAPLRGSILLVDDDAHVLEYMEDQLREWGLEVHAFADPGAALAAVAAGALAFDVAVLDQTMPGMSGLQLASALSGLLPDPRILLYTGYSDPISADECRDCDVIEVMHKPLDPTALHRLLRANLPA